METEVANVVTNAATTELAWYVFNVFSFSWFCSVVIFSCFLISFLQNDKNVLSFICLSAFLIFLNYFSNPGLSTVLPDLGLFGYIAIFGSYVAIGSVYSLFKWYLFCLSEKNVYDNYKRDFMIRNNLKDEEAFKKNIDLFKVDILLDKPTWANKIDIYSSKYKSYNDIKERITEPEAKELLAGFVLNINPSVYKNYGRITKWMVYWPWSLFWTLIDDFVFNIFNIIRNKLSGFMNRISESVFKDVNNDFKN